MDFRPILSFAFCCLCTATGHLNCIAQSRLDDAPIHYLESKGDNRITQLIDAIESGAIELDYEEGTGNLRSILQALEVPVSSQALVFSKTSLQTGRISPRNPRAIYFGDDVYVGWVRGSSLLEMSTADPALGAVYYTVQMTPRRPMIYRENNRCLGCHESTVDHGKIPVHTVRSVMTRANGNINLLLDWHVTDHNSPFEQRWGGWYVTGGPTTMKHMGNAFLTGDSLASLGESHASTLAGQFDLQQWPSASSDVVALMVLEHQTQTQNRLTSANYAVRRALNAAAEDPAGMDATKLESIVDESAKQVVDHLLFVGETKLDAEIVCSNSFTNDFSAKGPFSKAGRSLRQFDLQTRMFRYPCSYLIYSQAFTGLNETLRQSVLARLHRVLTGDDSSSDYAHLSIADRSDVLNILRETMDDLPSYWKVD